MMDPFIDKLLGQASNQPLPMRREFVLIKQLFQLPHHNIPSLR